MNTNPIIDNERFSTLKSDVGIEFIQELFDLFKSDYPPLIDELKVAATNRNFERLRFISHRMKSGGANLGAAEFSNQCHQLEKISESVSTEELVDRSIQLEAQYKQVVQSLSTLISSSSH